MGLTSNERKLYEERIETLNNHLHDDKVSLDELVIVNEYGDVRFRDPKRGDELRRKFFDRPIPGTERVAMEAVRDLLDAISPTDEQIARLCDQRAARELAHENQRRTHLGQAPLDELPKAKKAKPFEPIPVVAEQRTDVYRHHPGDPHPRTQAETRARHERGILTPKTYAAAQTLTPVDAVEEPEPKKRAAKAPKRRAAKAAEPKVEAKPEPKKTAKRIAAAKKAAKAK